MQPADRPRRWASLAWPTAAGLAFVLVTLATTVAAAVLDAHVDAAQRAMLETELGWTTGIAGLALCTPGAFLLRRFHRHPVAWILCITGLHWAVDGLAASWLAYSTAVTPALPGAALAHWTYQRLGAGLLLSLPLVLLFYPDGRLPSGRWRIASLASLAATALLPIVLLVVPSGIAQGFDGAPLPPPLAGLDLDLTTVALPGQAWPPLLSVAYAAVPASLIVPFAVVVRRYRAATGDARAPMRWLLWAAVVDLMVTMLSTVLPDGWTSIGLITALTVTGIAVTVGITRPGLFAIDRLLLGTLLYGGLAGAVLVVDVAVLSVATSFIGAGGVGERDAALVALLAVLGAYAALRDRLWRVLRRVVLGKRGNPYRVVAGLAEQLERSDAPEEQLLTVAHTVADAFRVPYVAVEVEQAGGQRLVAEHGTPPAVTQALPIAYRGEVVGRLILPRDGARATLAARDERLLGDVVRQAAAAARSSHLALALQRSREDLVNAREEERRRLRRDLHDGLGPSLGGVALRIDAARNLATRDPAEADRALREARDTVTAALADVRRLVHNLRPPALDDVGLLAAVRQQAQPLRPLGLTVRIEGGEDLEALPAAVEVAAFRIASEALTNVAKHAEARSCIIRFERDRDGLSVEVSDDGRGIVSGTPAGVGLVSMRERATELGGTCQVTCPAGESGTRVQAWLPIGRPVVTHG